MNRALYLLLAVLCSTPSLIAQHADLSQISDLDLSDYRARYERRPSWYVSGNMNYFTERFSSSAVTRFRMHTNTDQAISNYSVYIAPSLSWNEGSISDLFRLENQLEYNKQYFLRPKTSLGHELHLNTSWYQFLGQERSPSRVTPDAAASIYFAKGRVEYAEDALLAAWTAQDLYEAGSISSPSKQDVMALAQTITTLIGNRTFDLRRRRIYELEQLSDKIQALYPGMEVDFRFFSILNDNWTFANRQTLPHGKEWRVGLRTQANRAYSYRNNLETTYSGHQMLGVFTQYQINTIRNTKRSDSWQFGVELALDERVSKLTSFPAFGRERFNGKLYSSYTYRWIPNSRLASNWTNRMSFDRSNRKNTAGEWNTPASIVSFDSNLDINLFMSYQWRLFVDVDIDSWYIFETKQLKFNHFLGIGSTYDIL